MRRSATSGKEDSSRICDDALAAGDRRWSSGWDLPNAADSNRAILGYDDTPGSPTTVLPRQDCRKSAHEIPDGTASIPSSRSEASAGHA